MNVPIWYENKQKWILRFQEDGKVKSFVSRKAGVAGKRDVLKRYREYTEFGSVDRLKRTVSYVWDNFIQSTSKRLGANSEGVRLYSKIGRLYILDEIGNKRMSKLTKEDYQDLIDNAKPHDKRTEELSKKYLTTIRMVITVFVNYGVENGYCEGFKGSLYIPKGHRTIGKEILQPDQIRRMFEPSDLWFHNCFLFMICCGTRPSEALGLTWDNIKTEHIEIRKGITSTGQLSECKNENARRYIPLTPIIRQILNQQKEQTKHLNCPYVFCSSVGSAGSQSTMRKQFIKLKEERQIDGCLYSFRHTFITMCQSTLDDATLRMIVGHSKSFDQFGTYGNHLMDGQMSRAAELIDLRLKNTLHEKSE